MKNIILACAAGMSTSLLVKKMKNAAEEEGIEAHIEAMQVNAVASYEGEIDVLLLGPQVQYLYEDVKQKYEPRGIKVAVISMMDYGMMNGVKVLDDACAMIG